MKNSITTTAKINVENSLTVSELKTLVGVDDYLYHFSPIFDGRNNSNFSISAKKISRKTRDSHGKFIISITYSYKHPTNFSLNELISIKRKVVIRK